MEYFSAFEKQEILPFETSWMNLEDIMPSKARQQSGIQQSHSETETGSCQRLGKWGWKWGGAGHEVKVSGVQMSKFWRPDVQR